MEALRELREAVGAGHVLTDPDLRAGFERDVTGRFGAEAAAVVRPADTAQVARVLAICARHGIPVVPQGGNTGLVGGGVPRGGELVLSLTRLRELGEVDRAAAQVTAGAGVTLEALQLHARANGLDVGIDHGARAAATVGGMAATNAGGGLALRYGTMRAQVAGVEAVLGDGTVVDRLSGLLKDNAGYDLSALLVGSEGTLAVITRVAVRLVPIRRRRLAALFGLADLDAALALLTRLREDVPSLVAADFFDAAGLELVLAHRGIGAPFPRDWPVYLIAECAAGEDPTEALAAAVEASGLEPAVAVADDSAGRERLWAYRELQNEALAAAGVPHKLDVSVRVPDVPRFAAAVRERVAAVDPGARAILYGHLGDGNVHVNVLGPEPEDERVDDAVLDLVSAYRGSISAEHGVGVAKREHLGLSRGAGEIAAMVRLKAAFDPAGILNPGCLLPAAVASARS
ncbi:MAG TPA: FAD-binding oxidoreductase [Solirubrobacterales bacterium]|nr:FAD-binding oxidoreductase [Solirubrobacterales bacterium]